MASNSWLICQVILLLTINQREIEGGNGFTVDPPEDLVIFDPGHLGYLEISWSIPASLSNMTECPKLYQLEYFNTYRGSWTAVRTPRRTYSAQFDMMKEVRVRVYTLLCGPCTNGTMSMSLNYTELIQKPPSMGAVNTAIRHFDCVYHNMQYMECKWKRSAKTPANSQQNLYFWHVELEHAQECPKYLISSGVRIGCNFTGIPLPLFTDINFCVNGSSPEGPLRPKFTSLQIQNHVKPQTTEKLHLHMSPDMRLELSWDIPVGMIPEHCLNWVVEHNKEGPDGKIMSKKILTEQTRISLPAIRNKETNCFRVRSNLQKYCADKSFWSEWSHTTCHPGNKAAV